VVALTSAGGQTQASYTYEPFGTEITGVKPGAAAQKLSAVLECVDVSGSGFTAHFGYLNPNTYSVSIPVGTNNRFTPAPQDRGQTTVFLPGRKRDVFTVSVPTGTVLVWTLNGKTSTASGSSARCSAPASPESPFRFAGEQLDPATQLYNLRARQYSPGVGRFLSTDPLQADPAVSSYAYAGNDPTTFVDPSGLGAVWGNPCTSFRCLLKGVLKLAGWHSGCERSRLCLGLFAANVIPFVGEDVWLARAAAKAVEERPLLRSAAEACDLNSFTADTPVTMADGTSKPISQVRVGERVLATDPQTGKTQPRPVAAIIVHAGTHRIVELTLADGSRISATDHHPFWDATTHRFTDAIDLHTGDQVLEPDGTLIPITALNTKVEDLTAYNLTITGTHTYYAGTTAILVHNSCGGMGIHGNSGDSPLTAYLYRLTSTTGEYLKTGISQNPASRYPKWFMRDKEMEILTSGQRRDILNLERYIVERDRGKLNGEPWAGMFSADVP
jgi:RHS repeat-associated protein